MRFPDILEEWLPGPDVFGIGQTVLHVAYWQELNMAMRLAGTTLWTGIEEGKDIVLLGLNGDVVVSPGAEAGVGGC